MRNAFMWTGRGAAALALVGAMLVAPSVHPAVQMKIPSKVSAVSGSATKRNSLGGTETPIVASGASTAIRPDNLQVTGSYIEASVSKEHKNSSPNYPFGAEVNEKEGWVVLSVCVKIDGSVDHVVIDQSSGVAQFEMSALNSVRQYRFTPATHDGEPIEQCGLRVRINFAIHDLPRGARSSFRNVYDKARRALDSESYGEAKSLLEKLRPWNNYEGAYAAVLRLRVAVIEGDDDEALDQLREALRFNKVLEHPMERDLQHLRLSYELKAHRFADVLAQFDELELSKFEFNAMELSARSQLRTMLRSDQPIATPGKLKRQSRLPDELASWSVGLLRREIQFENLFGSFDRFELRCDFKRFVAKLNDTSTWKVPATWGACSLYVFGSEGATLKLVEYSPATAATPPAPIPAPGH